MKPEHVVCSCGSPLRNTVARLTEKGERPVAVGDGTFAKVVRRRFLVLGDCPNCGIVRTVATTETKE